MFRSPNLLIRKAKRYYVNKKGNLIPMILLKSKNGTKFICA